MPAEKRSAWTRFLDEPPELKHSFENKRYRTIAHTHDAGWVWGTEVIDLKFHGDSIRAGKVLTLTAEYAIIVQLEGNYHELYNR